MTRWRLESFLRLGAGRFFVEQIETIGTERLHDFGVDPHLEALFVQQVPAILQATEYIPIFEGQLAYRALGLVEALATYIAFRRLLTGLKDELGG